MLDILFNNNSEQQRGFSMIEMLISLTLMSMIMLLLGSGLKLISTSWDKNIKKIEMKQEVENLTEVFRRDVEGIRRIISKKDGKNSYIFSGTERELSIITKVPAYPSVPGLYQIRYSESSVSGKKKLLRQRRIYLENSFQIKKTNFMDNVTFFRDGVIHSFSYGRQNNSGITWVQEWTSKDQLPDLIKLSIISKGRLVSLPLTIRVKIDAEQECISEKNSTCSLKSGLKQQLKRNTVK